MIEKKMPVILLIGESGSGKNTVQDELERLYGCVPLLSYTTRPKRYDDENTHTFVTEEEFDKILKNEKVIAFTRFDEHRYCATNKQLEQSDVYIIDMEGLQTLLELKTNKEINIPFVAFYLQVPEEERIKRMRKRGDSERAIKQRIEHDRIAFQRASELCEYTIDNIDSTATAKMIYSYVYDVVMKND
ncbi:MAG: AAA family ATPase [Clostridia bacterium]|nr:AAA family ATPase [Clostridia bacterium]